VAQQWHAYRGHRGNAGGRQAVDRGWDAPEDAITNRWRIVQRAEHRQSRRARPSGPRLALAAYIAAWLAGAAVIAGVTLALIGGDDDERVAVPPVREIELTKAARLAGCELRRVPSDQASNPPVDGPDRVDPTRAGYYEEPPATPSLTAALRVGIVVIQFRDGLDEQSVEELKTIQQAAPDGTIVTPNATGMPYEVAAAAYRRLLGCDEYTEGAVDAIQLFRGRWIGSGPDS
jgi:hypothetical protein